MAKEDKYAGLESYTAQRQTPAPNAASKKANNLPRRKKEKKGLYIVEEWSGFFGPAYFFVRGYSPTRKEGTVRNAISHGLPGLPYEEAKLLMKQLQAEQKVASRERIAKLRRD